MVKLIALLRAILTNSGKKISMRGRWYLLFMVAPLVTNLAIAQEATETQKEAAEVQVEETETVEEIETVEETETVEEVETVEEQEALIIEDEQESYRVAIIDFSFETLSPEFTYLQKIIPNLLQQRLRAIAMHHYDQMEQRNFADYLQRQRISQMQVELSNLVAERDNQLLREGDQPSTEREEEIVRLQQEIVALQQLDSSRITVVTPKAMEIFRIERAPTERVPALAPLTRQNNVDLVVGGNISQQDEFLLVETFYYRHAEDRSYTLEAVLAGQDEIPFLATELSNRMALVVKGDVWGTLLIEGIGENTEIKLDGSVVGYGDSELLYLDVGSHTLELSRQGTLVAEQEVEVAPYESTKLSLELDSTELSTIRIESVPSGATVYVDSLWQGITPLEITTPATEQIVLAKKEGYFDTKAVIDGEAPGSLQLELRPRLFDTTDWLYSRRDNFYGALTAFIISLPIPIIFYGIYENIVNYQSSSSYRTLSAMEQGNLQNTANIMSAVRFGGIFLSVTLAIHSIIELVRYINAADLYHRL